MMVISKGQAKVKNPVEDKADDLIKLYSERSQLKVMLFRLMMNQHAFDDAEAAHEKRTKISTY